MILLGKQCFPKLTREKGKKQGCSVGEKRKRKKKKKGGNTNRDKWYFSLRQLRK